MVSGTYVCFSLLVLTPGPLHRQLPPLDMLFLKMLERNAVFSFLTFSGSLLEKVFSIESSPCIPLSLLYPIALFYYLLDTMIRYCLIQVFAHLFIF